MIQITTAQVNTAVSIATRMGLTVEERVLSQTDGNILLICKGYPVDVVQNLVGLFGVPTKYEDLTRVNPNLVYTMKHEWDMPFGGSLSLCIHKSEQRMLLSFICDDNLHRDALEPLPADHVWASPAKLQELASEYEAAWLRFHLVEDDEDNLDRMNELETQLRAELLIRDVVVDGLIIGYPEEAGGKSGLYESIQDKEDETCGRLMFVID